MNNIQACMHESLKMIKGTLGTSISIFLTIVKKYHSWYDLLRNRSVSPSQATMHAQKMLHAFFLYINTLRAQPSSQMLDLTF